MADGDVVILTPNGDALLNQDGDVMLSKEGQGLCCGGDCIVGDDPCFVCDPDDQAPAAFEVVISPGITPCRYKDGYMFRLSDDYEGGTWILPRYDPRPDYCQWVASGPIYHYARYHVPDCSGVPIAVDSTPSTILLRKYAASLLVWHILVPPTDPLYRLETLFEYFQQFGTSRNCFGEFAGEGVGAESGHVAYGGAFTAVCVTG